MAIKRFKRALHPTNADEINNRWLSDLTEALPQFIVYSATIDPASVSADSVSEQTFTVTGVRTDDHILSVTHGDIVGSGIMVADWRISAADTIAIVFENEHTAAINISSSTWEFLIMRMEA